MDPRTQADLILVVHAAYIAFNLVLPCAVALGGWYGWSWVRNSWLRNTHVLTLGIPVVEAIVRYPCPLTTEEWRLRGLVSSEGLTLAQSACNWLVYPELDPNLWRIGCVTYGAVTVLLYALVRPNWLRRRED